MNGMIMNLKNNDIMDKLVYLYTIKGQFHIYFNEQDNNFYKIQVDENKNYTPAIVFLISISSAIRNLIGKYVPDTAILYYLSFGVIGYYIAKNIIKKTNSSLFKNNLIYLERREFIDNFLFQAIKSNKSYNLIIYAIIFTFLFLSVDFFIHYETYLLFLLCALECLILLMLETKPYKRFLVLRSLKTEANND